MTHKQEVQVSNYGGVGFFGLLAIVFIVLKLTGYITWSWIWVLAPIWIPFILTVIFIIAVIWAIK